MVNNTCTWAIVSAHCKREEFSDVIRYDECLLGSRVGKCRELAFHHSDRKWRANMVHHDLGCFRGANQRELFEMT